MNQLAPFDIPLTGVHLVEASAGTGKTYNITSLYIRALVDRELTVENILVVTYTKAATKELRDRLLRRIRESMAALRSGEAGGDRFLARLLDHVERPAEAAGRLERALHDFDRAAVHTIHGFCNQVLQEQAFESGAAFDAEQVEDESEIIQEVLDDFWRRWLGEVEEEPWKEPMLRSLSDCGITADRLMRELGNHTGKPYLLVRPERPEPPSREEVEELQEAHEEMRSIWSRERGRIHELLLGDGLSYYREDWVAGWMQLMDSHLASPVASIRHFDRIGKFSQETLNGSLKKNADGPPPEHPFFRAVDRYLERAAALEQLPVWFRRRAFDFLTGRLKGRKEELQVYSYDDMLVEVRNALKKTADGDSRLARALRARYRLALVDEFQDTDPVQYEIFDAIYGRSGGENDAGETGLFLIGDPKQSIYSFRGADIHSYLEAKREIPDSRSYGLNYNFRTVPELIDAVNAFFSRHPDPFMLREIGFRAVDPGWPDARYERLTLKGERPAPCQFRLPAGDPGSLTALEAERLAAEDAAAEIARLLAGPEVRIGERRLRSEQVAVLVRYHSQADTMAEALRAWGINSVQVSKQSVFTTREAADLQQVLRAVAHPVSESLVRAALCTPLFGRDARALMELQENEEEWAALVERFRSWNEAWDARGFGYLFQSMMLEGDIARNLMRGERGERRVTNLVHLGELIADRERQIGSGHRSLLKWIARKRAEDRQETDEEQLRLESDEDLVRIVTMHRSKGLEYPVVFCPFIWRGSEFKERGGPIRYHDEERGRAVVDLRGKNDPGRAKLRFLQAREELAENLRLAYVAMTRASHRCCLTWIPAGYPHFSALGYLLYDPDTILPALRRKTGPESSDAPELDPFPEALRELAESHPECFECVRPEPAAPGRVRLEERDRTLEPARSFDGLVPEPAFQISSFSSLTGTWHGEEELPGLEYLFEEESPETPESLERGEDSVFTFPRGTRPGTCLHNIFEKLLTRDVRPWEAALEETVAKELRACGIAARWKKTACRMVRLTMEKELEPAGDSPLRLADFAPSDRLPEMEFHFRTGPAEGRKLLGLIREEAEGLPPLDDVPEGFLKGYIDLTLRHGGRYYLLDYKSNHLGDSAVDYRPERLREEVLTANYDLQYHLYTVALHRYLSRRLPGYDYETHFGGVWYLFLRGINPEGDEGLYFDRPPAGRVRALDRMLRGEGA